MSGPEFEGLGGGEFGPYFQSRRHAIYEKWSGETAKAAIGDYEQSPAWKPREIHLGDGRTLVLEST